MDPASEIGTSVTNGLAYTGDLALLGGRAAYLTVVAPFQGNRIQRALSEDSSLFGWSAGRSSRHHED